MSNKKKEILLRAYIGFLAIFLLGMAIIGLPFSYKLRKVLTTAV